MSVTRDKAALRRRALEGLRTMEAGERAGFSKELVRRLLELPDLRAGHCLLAFAPLNTEPAIESGLETLRGRGLRLLLPRMGAEPGSLEVVEPDRSLEALPRDALGVRSPETGALVPLEEIGTVLVPGLMFDTWGQRLGRGGGYYDRLLERLPAARLVGTCFERSVCERVPVESHDRPVDLLITERRRVDCRKRSS